MTRLVHFPAGLGLKRGVGMSEQLAEQPFRGSRVRCGRGAPVFLRRLEEGGLWAVLAVHCGSAKAHPTHHPHYPHHGTFPFAWPQACLWAILGFPGLAGEVRVEKI